MRFTENEPLNTLNTFHLPGRARFFAVVRTEAELRRLLGTVTARNLPIWVLGGGSNILLLRDFPGLMIKPELSGIRLLDQDDETVLVEAGAGECWADFVQYCLAMGWYGIENLSLIPGTVGAAPIQNIGAYGVELVDNFDSLDAMAIASGDQHTFSRANCRFGYRDSVFKQHLAGQFIITRVRFRLRRKAVVRVAYGDIRQQLADQGITEPTPRQVSEAIIAIRRRKLPDPAVLGNAGSFFKNPVIPARQADELRARFPTMVSYPAGDQHSKLAAGWLIEQAGWRGRRMGAVGPYERQALVMVNHGGANGEQLLRCAQAIQDDVLTRFGVHLEMEPLIVQ